MKKTRLLSSLILGFAGVLRLATGPLPAPALNPTHGTAHANISISARVDEFCEWADPAPILIEGDWSGPINRVNQERLAAKSVVLYANADTILTAHAGLNHGILTRGASTLDTAYKLTGPLADPDQRFKPAAEFFSAQNTYTLVHVPGTGAYTFTLEVQMSSPPATAPEPGLYTCGITLTAGW